MRWGVRVTMSVWSEDSVQALLLSFHHVYSGNWSQVIRVGSQQPSCWPKAAPFYFLSSLLRGFWFLHILTTASCPTQLLTVLCVWWPRRAWNALSLCSCMCFLKHACDRISPCIPSSCAKYLLWRKVYTNCYFAHFLTELCSSVHVCRVCAHVCESTLHFKTGSLTEPKAHQLTRLTQGFYLSLPLH